MNGIFLYRMLQFHCVRWNLTWLLAAGFSYHVMIWQSSRWCCKDFNRFHETPAMCDYLARGCLPAICHNFCMLKLNSLNRILICFINCTYSIKRQHWLRNSISRPERLIWICPCTNFCAVPCIASHKNEIILFCIFLFTLTDSSNKIRRNGFN